jgi:branched-chain amino acid transport system permease protein
MSQYFVNALLAASVWVLVGLGFALVFRVAKFFHFAHGAIFTVGAYATFVMVNWLGLPLWASIPIGVTASVVIGCSLDIAVFALLRRKGSSPLVLLLASLGLYVILQNMISMVFGDSIQTIRTGTVEEGIAVFGARITGIQIATVVVSALLVVAIGTFLKATKMGTVIRAVSSDPQLARVCGIESDRVVLVTFAIGSALAGIAGILVALDVDMTPTMGMHALMMGVVAVIIGGKTSIPGIALGALLLGMAQHLGVWAISSQWQDAIAFVILLVFLLLKPEGFMGKKVREATV